MAASVPFVESDKSSYGIVTDEIALIAHRFDCEREILAALEKGIQTVDKIAAAVYADLASELFPAAAGTVLAHLIWLVDKGAVRADPEPRQKPRFWRQ